jgi:hypothetical protein
MTQLYDDIIDVTEIEKIYNNTNIQSKGNVYVFFKIGKKIILNFSYLLAILRQDTKK